MALQPLLRLLLRPAPPPPPPTRRTPHLPAPSPTRRGTAAALLLLAVSAPPPRPALAEDDVDEPHVVRLFEEATPSVVFIKDLLVAPRTRGRGGGGAQPVEDEEGGATVEGTGSGFVWDSLGHIVTNYHVVAKLAGDGSASHRCKVFLEDSSGTSYSKDGRLIGYDPTYDLAVLKVDVDGDKLSPALLGTSQGLRVGQSCFAIGNPLGYEHTLTTGGAAEERGRARARAWPGARQREGAAEEREAGRGRERGQEHDSRGERPGAGASAARPVLDI